MRTTSIVGIVVATCAVGCIDEGPGTHGETLKRYNGTVSVVFTNATPETMCNLSMSADDNGSYGDNWLPTGGLPSGKSAEFRVKPGRYKATWNTCHHAGSADPWYAGTLLHERGFEVAKDAVQLFAYVADTVAPTQRAAILAYHSVVRFEGMTITATTGRVDERPDVVAAAPAAQPAAKLDVKDWVDPKAQAKKRPKIRPSVARTHDMANDAQVGYRPR